MIPRVLQGDRTCDKKKQYRKIGNVLKMSYSERNQEKDIYQYRCSVIRNVKGMDSEGKELLCRELWKDLIFFFVLYREVDVLVLEI